MFNFIKDKLKYIYDSFSLKIKSIFSKGNLDNETLKELEKVLINADTGVSTTKFIVEKLKNEVNKSKLEKAEDLKNALENILNSILNFKDIDINNFYDSDIYLLVGINGSGKTTFAAKLANYLKNKGYKVLLVAADTFRAAAVAQLNQWAHKIDVDILTDDLAKDPASVVFKGCEKFINENYDKIIIDTAGRLENKVNLMKELEKIKKIINNKLSSKKILTLLTIDAMLGQNSFQQAKIFNESTNLSGIVLTKLDGTGKGGIIFSIVKELNIPILFISYGEKINELKKFNPKEYVKDLLS